MTQVKKYQQEIATRRQVPKLSFKPGDMVWLNARNVCIQRAAVKLDNKRLRLFPNNWNYWIVSFQPGTIRLNKYSYGVSHFTVGTGGGWHLTRTDTDISSPVLVDCEEKYDMKEIQNSYIWWKILQYLVKWRRYTQLDWMSTWDVNGLPAIDKFHILSLKRPAPLLKNGK